MYFLFVVCVCSVGALVYVGVCMCSGVQCCPVDLLFSAEGIKTGHSPVFIPIASSNVAQPLMCSKIKFNTKRYKVSSD